MGLTPSKSGSQPAALARASNAGCHCWLVQQCSLLAFTLLVTLPLLVLPAHSQSATDQLPTIQEMIASRTDVWGDAARQQPNGASYTFFENLLPPLRWVNTDFRHYPIVLSAAGRAKTRARLQRQRDQSAREPAANVV